MMMQGIRKASQGLLGKLVISLLFGVLILAFAIWGVGDIFRGYGRNEVAKVGKSEIGIEQMRTAYQNEIQNLIRQQRRQISPETARALGLDRQVLSRLLADATLDQTAKAMGLAVSDETIRNLIFDDQVFRDAAGKFSADRFNELLRTNGYTEQSYVAIQRQAVLRQELAEMITGGFTVPVALQEIGSRLRNEKRAVTFARMPASAAGEIAAPTEEQLKTFYNDRKIAFRAPEYRTASVLALTADTLADPAKVTEVDAKARYEAEKARFTTAETRTVQQIAFPNEEEAKAARAKIDGGETFDEIATERNVAFADLTLGTFTRAQIFDPAVRDAAFALEENAVSAPVKSAFGSVLLRVTKVEPQHVRPFEEVAEEVKAQVAASRASSQITDLHDKIEDERASAKPLAEIAKQFGIALRTAGPMSQAMAKPDGSKEAPLPGGDATLRGIFASDLGVDNEAIRLPQNGGYVWFDVSKIDPARDRPFEEVKAEVEQQWRADETASKLSAKARELVERLDKGESFDAVSASAGLTVETAADLGRQDQRPELPGNVVSQIFGTYAGKSGSAGGVDGGRILFKVDSATTAPFVRTTQEAENFVKALSGNIADDMLQQYVSRRQAELGVSVNEAAFRNATGGAQN
ncbi:SurA N-terminal domain-containing protein [Bosea sp. TND4EK4]|uniref:SurA N-terminal domain-containing protein n=1 Tax=Bosea sp. TND4EK4 TaxID=1907408 RepID=UPI00095436B8|nr:SurA N-terminal domain-containing protein [Bosea sp. TND4EK4]SIQ46880.1 peptidyl-prolyl cis-trans isomerase D [Bosea sp. TND4EK4]